MLNSTVQAVTDLPFIFRNVTLHPVANAPGSETVVPSNQGLTAI